MHESSLAGQLLAAVIRRAALEGMRQVTEVRGWVADYEALAHRTLQEHFAAEAVGTVAEGALLEVRIIRVGAQCGRCGKVFDPSHHLLLCTWCGCTDGKLLGPTGLGIEAVLGVREPAPPDTPHGAADAPAPPEPRVDGGAPR